jgi:hypothetical protein
LLDEKLTVAWIKKNFNLENNFLPGKNTFTRVKTFTLAAWPT